MTAVLFPVDWTPGRGPEDEEGGDDDHGGPPSITLALMSSFCPEQGLMATCCTACWDIRRHGETLHLRPARGHGGVKWVAMK